MARMHSGKKGKSGSKKPIKKVKPSWLDYNPKEIEQLIIKLAKAGSSPSIIGIILRDSYGIPNVKNIIKKKIINILEENRLMPNIPEDLHSLIKKESKIIKHLEINKKDMSSKRGLQLTNSKIQRLTKYYKREGTLPNDWTYEKGKIY